MSSSRLLMSVCQGNLGARRARYEATWHTFVTAIAGGKKGLKYADIPWPAEDPDDARAILMYGTTTPAEVCTPSTLCVNTPLQPSPTIAGCPHCVL